MGLFVFSTIVTLVINVKLTIPLKGDGSKGDGLWGLSTCLFYMQCNIQDSGKNCGSNRLDCDKSYQIFRLTYIKEKLLVFKLNHTYSCSL